MNPVIKRLLPLFVANFFMGLMFHYSIAFPFFNSIGFAGISRCFKTSPTVN